jgi:hypothetical protein
MENKIPVILLEGLSKDILNTRHYVKCKCFRKEPGSNMREYQCIVKERDFSCDLRRESINATMVVENIKDLDEYFKICRQKRQKPDITDG